MTCTSWCMTPPGSLGPPTPPTPPTPSNFTLRLGFGGDCRESGNYVTYSIPVTLTGTVNPPVRYTFNNGRNTYEENQAFYSVRNDGNNAIITLRDEDSAFCHSRRLFVTITATDSTGYSRTVYDRVTGTLA